MVGRGIGCFILSYSRPLSAQSLNVDAMYKMRLEFGEVGDEIERQAGKVRTESANVFKVYGSKESSACMRRDSVWGSVDLNDRLTKDIFEGVMASYDLEQTSRNETHSEGNCFFCCAAARGIIIALYIGSHKQVTGIHWMAAKC